MTKKNQRERFQNNPFMIKEQDLTIRKKSVLAQNKNMAMVNLDTKELSGVGMVVKKKVDTEKFLKLYEDGIREMMELDSYGIKMFRMIFLASANAIDKDKIYLHYSDPKINESMARTTFTRGIKNLIEKQFIAPCMEVGFFWINPSYIFNGNRLTMIKQYELEGREKNPPKEYELRDAKPSYHEAEQYNLPYEEKNPYDA